MEQDTLSDSEVAVNSVAALKSAFRSLDEASRTDGDAKALAKPGVHIASHSPPASGSGSRSVSPSSAAANQQDRQHLQVEGAGGDSAADLSYISSTSEGYYRVNTTRELEAEPSSGPATPTNVPTSSLALRELDGSLSPPPLCTSPVPADDEASQRLPKRLSEAFQSELSPDLLVYLNIRTGMELSQTKRKQAASADSGTSQKDTDLWSLAESDELSLPIPDEPEEPSNTSSMARSLRRSLRRAEEASSRRSRRRRARETMIFGPDDADTKAMRMDEYFKVRRELRLYRQKLAEQGEANFRLEKNLRALDERIGLLVHHRITVEDIDARLLNYNMRLMNTKIINERMCALYGNLLHFLQNEPKLLAELARQLSMSEIDDLLETILFSLYGNFEPREEHLLLTMFDHAIHLEFKEKTIGSAMRSNSAVSRMMSNYTRRGLGQQYLKDALSPHIELVYSMETMNLNISPLKVYRELRQDYSELPDVGDDSDKALQHPMVRARIEERCRCIQELCSSFLNAIISSIQSVPYGVRWLCKIIRNHAKRHHEDVTREQIDSLLGGFFLLRYINPAIISPEAYGIKHKKPPTNVRQNLTQLAKVLQTLANNTTFSKLGVIDFMNDFIKAQRARLRTFWDDLCDVKDFYPEHKLENIKAVTAINKTMSIAPNRIYSLHKLLIKYKIGDEKKESGRRLNELLKELGDPPALLSKKDNVLMELQLTSRWEPLQRRESFFSADDAQDISAEELDRVREEALRTKDAFESLCENFAYLTDKLEAYQVYLENVRGQALAGSTLKTEFASIGMGMVDRDKRVKHYMLPKGLGPFVFKLPRLDRDGIVISTNPQVIPAAGSPLRSQVLVTFSMPQVGHVVISVQIKGRQPLCHIQRKFEEILSKLEDERPLMDLGEVVLDARKMLVLVDRAVLRS